MRRLYKNRRLVKCPRCKYSWKTKQKGFICCSYCKRYFKIKNEK